MNAIKDNQSQEQKPSSLHSVVRRLTECAEHLRLPFVLHKSGRGKPGRGSCWTVESLYPVEGVQYPGKVFAAAPTLPEAIEAFHKRLKAKKS